MIGTKHIWHESEDSDYQIFIDITAKIICFSILDDFYQKCKYNLQIYSIKNSKNQNDNILIEQKTEEVKIEPKIQKVQEEKKEDDKNNELFEVKLI